MMYAVRPLNQPGYRSNKVALTGLLVLLVSVFLLGGSARGDEWAVVVLRPISFFALGVAVVGVNFDQLRNNKFVIGWIVVVVFLPLAHLVPLPPEILEASPGQAIIQDIIRALSMRDDWRPISASPELTRNAFWSMAAPAACFLFAMQLTDRQIYIVMRCLVLLAVFGGVLAVAQITQGSGGTLYIYRITNYGSGVGLFANRNHHAVFLAYIICLIYAVYLMAGEFRVDRQLNRLQPNHLLNGWMAALGIMFTIALIIVSGSRSGAFLGMVSLVFVWRAFGSQRSTNREFTEPRSRISFFGINRVLNLSGSWIFPISVLITIMIVMLTGQDLAFQRILETSSAEKSRIEILPTLVTMAGDFFITGSGTGSFEPVFKLYEPYELLAPGYWNHAHNDWLETAITTGIPGLLILTSGVAWLCVQGVRFKALGQKAKPAIAFALAGYSLVLLCALASVIDYPLRTPIIACCLMIAVNLIQRAGAPAPAAGQ